MQRAQIKWDVWITYTNMFLKNKNDEVIPVCKIGIFISNKILKRYKIHVIISQSDDSKVIESDTSQINSWQAEWISGSNVMDIS